jgi:hypothetical protein
MRELEASYGQLSLELKDVKRERKEMEKEVKELKDQVRLYSAVFFLFSLLRHSLTVFT